MADNLLDKITSDIAPQSNEIERKDDPFRSVGVTGEFNPLIADIKAKLDESERSRQVHERQWLRNVNSYRGNDSSEGHFRNSEINKVFVRTTTVKVKAAYSQITESLFSDGRFPVQVTNTPIPDGISEYGHLRTDMSEDATVPYTTVDRMREAEPVGGVGFEGDGFDIVPGSTQTNMSFLGGAQEEFTGKDGESVLTEGPARDMESPQVALARRQARKMDKTIQDSLEESKARTETRKSIFEMCLLGTGIMKGPFNVNKDLHMWEEDETGERVYAPKTVTTPRVSMVSTWNFYPDPNATRAEEMEWCIERHKMNSAQLRSLKKRPHFDSRAIDSVLMKPGNYERRSFEHTLDQDNFTEADLRAYEVLEFWGFMGKEMLKEFNLPQDAMIDDQVQVNVWISGNEVLRVVLNPFIPQRIPYYVVPYEVDPYTMWGTGVPESMEDSQSLMNGLARLAVDNLALSGNLVFDIDESMLVPGQTMDIYPGKTFVRHAGGAGQAVHGISFPNTAPANMQLFKEFRQFADESTGIPSFAHGQTGVLSPTRTASGMSMLLNNASLNIKTVVRNIDDYFLKPLGEGMFRWHMQFNPDTTIQGDLEVKATGTSSLQAKEVRSQRLNSFLQMAANPALAPLIKLPTVLREFAVTMDIDPEEILNSPDEARVYAELMGLQGMQQPGQPGSPEATAPDGVPSPNEPGFTGNNLGAGNELAALQAGGLGEQPV